MNEPLEVIAQRLAEPFFKDGAAHVYVHDCCGWVVVSHVAQKACSTCKQEPASQVLVRPAGI